MKNCVYCKNLDANFTLLYHLSVGILLNPFLIEFID